MQQLVEFPEAEVVRSATREKGLTFGALTAPTSAAGESLELLSEPEAWLVFADRGSLSGDPGMSAPTAGTAEVTRGPDVAVI